MKRKENNRYQNIDTSINNDSAGSPRNLLSSQSSDSNLLKKSNANITQNTESIATNPFLSQHSSSKQNSIQTSQQQDTQSVVSNPFTRNNQQIQSSIQTSQQQDNQSVVSNPFLSQRSSSKQNSIQTSQQSIATNPVLQQQQRLQSNLMKSSNTNITQNDESDQNSILSNPRSSKQSSIQKSQQQDVESDKITKLRRILQQLDNEQTSQQQDTESVVSNSILRRIQQQLDNEQTSQQQDAESVATNSILRRLYQNQHDAQTSHQLHSARNKGSIPLQDIDALPRQPESNRVDTWSDTNLNVRSSIDSTSSDLQQSRDMGRQTNNIGKYYQEQSSNDLQRQQTMERGVDIISDYQQDKPLSDNQTDIQVDQSIKNYRSIIKNLYNKSSQKSQSSNNFNTTSNPVYRQQLNDDQQEQIDVVYRFEISKQYLTGSGIEVLLNMPFFKSRDITQTYSLTEIIEHSSIVQEDKIIKHFIQNTVPQDELSEAIHYILSTTHNDDQYVSPNRQAIPIQLIANSQQFGNLHRENRYQVNIDSFGLVYLPEYNNMTNGVIDASNADTRTNTEQIIQKITSAIYHGVNERIYNYKFLPKEEISDENISSNQIPTQ